ncbi:uncharacterized protein LOC127003876 [Eriocheir sinensis]|uniref:uncharacterized protein LOC127003876 n=1 Tax=Eriocheir sinensis TaxID=95602 RepID=UPI0021C636D9|nr:uncharacterized protein LOC127003876 [Eriocheir sinensis]
MVEVLLVVVVVVAVLLIPTTVESFCWFWPLKLLPGLATSPAHHSRCCVGLAGASGKLQKSARIVCCPLWCAPLLGPSLQYQTSGRRQDTSRYFQMLPTFVSAISKALKGDQSGPHKSFFRFMAQRKGRTTTRATKLPLEMPQTHKCFSRFTAQKKGHTTTRATKLPLVMPRTHKCFSRFMAQRKGHTTTRATKLPLEMPQTPTKALLNVCTWVSKGLSVRTHRVLCCPLVLWFSPQAVTSAPEPAIRTYRGLCCPLVLWFSPQALTSAPEPAIRTYSGLCCPLVLWFSPQALTSAPEPAIRTYRGLCCPSALCCSSQGDQRHFLVGKR